MSCQTKCDPCGKKCPPKPVYPPPCGKAIAGPQGLTGYTGPAGSATGTLAGLTDVTVSSPANGSFLYYQGGTWVNNSDRVNIGTSVTNVTAGSVGVGSGAVATGTNSTALGDTAKATGNGSVVIGHGAIDNGQNNTTVIGSVPLAPTAPGTYMSVLNTVAPGGPSTTASWGVAPGTYNVVVQNTATGEMTLIPVTLS